MFNEFLNLGRDPDEIAMATDNRSLKETIKDWLRRKISDKKYQEINIFDIRNNPQKPDGL